MLIEHFDANDERCIASHAYYSVVTAEPEWDDASRARATRLDEHERSIDQETGLSKDVAYSNRPFIVHNDVINYAAKATAKVRAADAEAHKDEPGWMDGRRYIAQPYTPDDQD